MIRHRFLPNTIAGLSVILALGLSATALGQTRIINPSKRFTVPRTNSINTATIQPQIQIPPPRVFEREAAENDYSPWLPREASNNLVAGKLLNMPRGYKRKLFPGPVDQRFIPPDCDMAVGPNHIVTVINTTIAFYTKTGTKTFEVTMDGPSGFFAGTAQTDFVFDPKCFYDPISNRFFVIALDLDEGNTVSNSLIAVSDDSNPNGNWHKYRINSILSQGGTDYWLDYPGFGFNKDAVVVTGNMFGIGGGYFGVQALVIKKASLLTGGTADVTVLLEPGTGTVQPTRTSEAASDKIFAVARGGGNAVRFYAFTNLTGTPQMKQINVTVPSYGAPGGPAPSGSNVIDALDGRIMTAHFKKSQVVAAHTVSISGNSHAVRWYSIAPNSWPNSGTPSLRQAGDITQSGAAMHMPAIAINSFEDISVIYTRSSSSRPSDLMISSRFKTDAPGMMGQPVELVSTSGNYPFFRWGDYFGIQVDPADDTTFWGFGMVAGSSWYETHILSWTVTAPGGATGTPISATATNTFMGTYLIGDPATIANSDDLYYQVGSAGSSAIGQGAGIEADFTIPTETTNITVQLEAIAGVSGGTNNVWLMNWSTGQFELLGSTPLLASGNTSKLMNVPLSKVARYIGAGGAVKVRLRGHIPKRPFSTSLPPPFNYRIDQLQLVVR